MQLQAVRDRRAIIVLQAKGDVQIAEQDSLVSGTLYMAGKEHQDQLNMMQVDAAGIPNFVSFTVVQALWF